MVRRSSRLQNAKTNEVVLQLHDAKRVSKLAKKQPTRVKPRAGTSRSIPISYPSSSSTQHPAPASVDGASDPLRRSARIKAAAQTMEGHAPQEQQKSTTDLKERPKKATKSRKAKKPAARRATKVNNEQKIVPPAPISTTSKSRSTKKTAVRSRASQAQNAIGHVARDQPAEQQAPTGPRRSLRRHNPVGANAAAPAHAKPTDECGAPGKCAPENQSTAPDTEMAIEGSSVSMRFSLAIISRVSYPDGCAKDSRLSETAGLPTNGDGLEREPIQPSNMQSSPVNVEQSGEPVEAAKTTLDLPASLAPIGSISDPVLGTPLGGSTPQSGRCPSFCDALFRASSAGSGGLFAATSSQLQAEKMSPMMPPPRRLRTAKAETNDVKASTPQPPTGSLKRSHNHMESGDDSEDGLADDSPRVTKKARSPSKRPIGYDSLFDSTFSLTPVQIEPTRNDGTVAKKSERSFSKRPDGYDSLFDSSYILTPIKVPAAAGGDEQQASSEAKKRPSEQRPPGYDSLFDSTFSLSPTRITPKKDQ